MQDTGLRMQGLDLVYIVAAAVAVAVAVSGLNPRT